MQKTTVSMKCLCILSAAALTLAIPGEGLAQQGQQQQQGTQGRPLIGSPNVEVNTEYENRSVLEVIQQRPEFSELEDALIRANMLDRLQQEGSFTIFAPTNSAFKELPEAMQRAVMYDQEWLTNALNYHIVPQRVNPNAVPYSDLSAMDTTQKSYATAASDAWKQAMGALGLYDSESRISSYPAPVPGQQAPDIYGATGTNNQRDGNDQRSGNRNDNDRRNNANYDPTNGTTTGDRNRTVGEAIRETGRDVRDAVTGNRDNNRDNENRTANWDNQRDGNRDGQWNNRRGGGVGSSAYGIQVPTVGERPVTLHFVDGNLRVNNAKVSDKPFLTKNGIVYPVGSFVVPAPVQYYNLEQGWGQQATGQMGGQGQAQWRDASGNRDQVLSTIRDTRPQTIYVDRDELTRGMNAEQRRDFERQLNENRDKVPVILLQSDGNRGTRTGDMGARGTDGTNRDGNRNNDRNTGNNNRGSNTPTPSPRR